MPLAAGGFNRRLFRLAKRTTRDGRALRSAAEGVPEPLR